MQRPTPTDNEVTWSRWLAEQLGGEREFRTHDGSRVDILTDDHAIEVEWVKKWAQAVGQAVFYAAVTGRRPAIILLLRDKPNEQTYVLRCAVACAAAGIALKLEQTR